METVSLILPRAEHRADVLDFYRVMAENGDHCIGSGNGGDFDRWLPEMQNRRLGQNLPAGYVPEDFYLCYAGRELVGVFSLKRELSDYLLRYGGHVGYAVRPDRRGEGWAKAILRRGLTLAGELGMDRVLAVCDEDNAPSEHVIRACGGVLENTLFDPEEQVNVRRFWIPVP